MTVCHASAAKAADVNAGFEQGNKLYEQGKFREAAETYGGLTQAGDSSAALFFNLGNAQFKSGQVGRSIVSFRQAATFAPRDPDVRANLQFARNQVHGPRLRPGWLRRQAAALTTNEWTLIAMTPVWLLFALLIAVQIKPSLKKSLRSPVLAVGALAVLACAAAGFALNQQLNGQTAVVIARDTVVRFGPLEVSPESFTAADGAELAVLDAKDDWLQVSDGGRRSGWLKTNAVVVLK
jgi:hypothetical protein